MTNASKSPVVAYVSKGGTTKSIAQRIADAIGAEVPAINLADFSHENATRYDWWILGSPTYGLGELDYRWKKWMRDLDFEKVRESGVRISLFVLGDQKWHGKTFVGSLVDFSDPFRKAGIPLSGSCPASDFTFEHSPAVDEQGRFPGLVVDEQSESEKTDGRIDAWLSTIHPATL